MAINANQTPPSFDDLKRVANALIQIHDYGVSFKTAFGLSDKRGRKPKATKASLISDGFQTMSEGFFGDGGSLELLFFLGSIGKGKAPKVETLQHVADALTKMHDESKSLKSAFGLIEKTGSKGLGLSGHKIDFLIFYRSSKWKTYYAYRKYKSWIKHKRRGETAITLMSDDTGLSTRQIERDLAETKKHHHLSVPVIRKCKNNWAFYFSNRKFLSAAPISEAIKLIAQNNGCSLEHVYSRLANIYEEVVISKKYALITRGTRDYPRRLSERIKAELYEAYCLENAVNDIEILTKIAIAKNHTKMIRENGKFRPVTKTEQIDEIVWKVAKRMPDTDKTLIAAYLSHLIDNS